MSRDVEEGQFLAARQFMYPNEEEAPQVKTQLMSQVKTS